ncbi:winged helix-turn-helix transcriptional regulator [Microcystis aeruginosa]|uniref:winged helix-turn-helix transcriptional regulator n=1 Tax=Microcystis aeruginosa TaxID=1126 RepID=UPI0023309389|nr:winged helix-turn-helix transcriptional regulator [Microcystis aeruginosa]MDB9390562.1 winged helix-turn-helix transcriptional regulator [Microcystis aeruginosa CS-579]
MPAKVEYSLTAFGENLKPIILQRHQLGLAEKVGAKHSDRKSTVSAIGYARMLRPYRTRADEDARF